MMQLNIASARTESIGPRLIVTTTVYESAPIRMGGARWESAALVHSTSAAPSSPAYHERFWIRGELPGGYWLARGLPIDVRIQGDEFVAVQDHLALHAFGPSPVEAVLRLRESLAEHYGFLKKLGDNLTEHWGRQRELLRELILSGGAQADGR